MVCGQSSSSPENGRAPCRGAIDEDTTGSLWEFIMPRTGFSLGNARALLPPPSGASHLLLSMKTSPGWRPGGSPALFYRASNPACAGRGRAPSPVPPGATPTIVHRPGSQESVASWSLHGHHCLTRAAGDPHQNPQSKMKWSTSGAFHLILSMQYHLTRRARSREVRLLGGRVPFALFAPSREVAIACPASGPAT